MSAAPSHDPAVTTPDVPASAATPEDAPALPYPRPGFGMPEASPALPGSNAYAIAALAMVCVFWPASLVLSTIALVQIRRRPQRGEGMASAALLISGLMLALTVYVVWQWEPAPDGGRASDGVAWQSLRPGDCLAQLGDDPDYVRRVFTMPCSTPHQAEVFGVVSLTVENWPGEEAVDQQVSELCTAALTTYAPEVDVDGIDLYVFQPTEASWFLEGERRVVCMAQAADYAPGSIRD